MENTKEGIVALAKPYDDSMWDRWNMYDKMPYVWDADLCGTKKLMLESGNIIKFYRCMTKEPFEVRN
ncbi:MAG TPA: hypothetical protein VJZ06_10565 [Mobilitalea sp.]|nr:hypothetical protein [Mobilitalea sp.]